MGALTGVNRHVFMSSQEKNHNPPGTQTRTDRIKDEPGRGREVVAWLLQWVGVELCS